MENRICRNGLKSSILRHEFSLTNVKSMLMKRTILSVAMLAGLWATASAGSSFRVLEQGATAGGMSPAGNYVVGYNPDLNECNVYLESYLYNRESMETVWVTKWDEKDLSLCGQLSDVSDTGVACGVSKDMDNILTWVDPVFNEEFTGHTQVATIWESGVKTLLPFGEVDVADFTQLEDGTFAVAISADGNAVAGFVAYGNMAVIKPCLWKRGSDGVWTMKMLDLPDGATSPVVRDISADGRLVAGGFYGSDGPKVICWKDGVCNVLEGPAKANPDDYVNIQALSVSASGRYILMSYNMTGMVYDTENGDYRLLPVFGDYNSLATTAAIDDNGNVYGVYNGYPSNRPFIYLYESDRLLDLGYYMSSAAPDLQPEYSFEPGSTVTINAVSADGRWVMGNSSYMFGTGWLMELDATEIVIPDTPSIGYAFSREPGGVTLRWNVDSKEYSGYSRVGYNVYRDNAMLDEVAVDGDLCELSLREQPVGYSSYIIEGIYGDDAGNLIRSPKSNPVSVAVPDNYSLPLFDDFEVSLEQNYWTKTSDYGNALDTGWSCFMGTGVDNGSGLYSTISSKTPYSFGLVSRPLDASEEEYVSVSFGFIFALVNEPVQVLDKDFISLDYSLDMGDSWTEAGCWSLDDMSAGNWCFKSLDLSDAVGGKLFLIRLRRHGEGVAQYISAVDNLAVNVAATVSAPSGLTGVRTDDGGAHLIWKSQSGSYNLNHLGNLRTMNMAFGNEGKDMIGASLFEAADLKAYAGKYITSVSALINYYSWQEDILGIHATAVIFEDGEIVREQEFEDMVYNGYTSVRLDEPLLIDGGKEIRVGVRIHDYDEWQWPICAAVADDYVPGKTDLYTYDDGKTWSRLSDLYDVADIQGHCIWDITAHVGDETESDDVDFMEMPLLYNVYRDGVLLNRVAIDGNATSYKDMSAYDNASYRIMAHAGDGAVSPLSEVNVSFRALSERRDNSNFAA